MVILGRHPAPIGYTGNGNSFTAQSASSKRLISLSFASKDFLSGAGTCRRPPSCNRPLTVVGSGQYAVHNMKAITYTAAREGLAATMDKVCRNRAPIIITRNRDQSVVMLSLADYEQLEETAYLLRSPTNARRLLSAMGSLEKGRGRERKITLEA